jgi:hypothetical protein
MKPTRHDNGDNPALRMARTMYVNACTAKMRSSLARMRRWKSSVSSCRRASRSASSSSLRRWLRSSACFFFSSRCKYSFDSFASL